MLTAIHQRLGYRLPLGHLAGRTLAVSKREDGLLSLARWKEGPLARWKEGRVDEIERYRILDVTLLRDLLEHAAQHGHLCFQTQRDDRMRLPAPWKLDELTDHTQSRSSQLAPPPQAHSAQTSSAQTKPASKRRRLRWVESDAARLHST